MLSWIRFEHERPDLAAQGRAAFYGYGLGLGYLATVRRDGAPRLHPMCPIISTEGLFALIVPGPKLQDLRRDGRFAMQAQAHPAPPRHDDAFYVSGIAIEQADPALWERLAVQFLAERKMTTRWPGFEDQVPFEFHIDRCMLTRTAATDGFPAGPTVWRADGQTRAQGVGR